MNEVPTESFGFVVKSPLPADFGLNAQQLHVFGTVKGWFKSFNPAYAAVKHKEAAFKQYRKALEDYSLACYRGRTEFWLAMTPRQFELEVARVFIGLGWETQVVGGSGDLGIDLTLRKGGKFAVAQCKAYNKTVGPAAVRDLHSAVMTAGASRGYLVSMRGFSKGAVEAAVGKPIVLANARDLACAELSTLAKNMSVGHPTGSVLLWDV